MRYFSLVWLVLICWACQPASTDQHSGPTNEAPVNSYREQPAIPLVASLEEAHRADSFHQKKAIAFDLELYFGGEQRLSGRITSMTNSAQVKLARKDGVTVVFDGEKVFQAPDTVDYPSARFDILTWPYFLMAPFKFSDPGTKWKTMADMPLNSSQLLYPCGKLTFSEGIGDAPDDWYIAYQNPTGKKLAALAYIVTFNASQTEAEADPHAITYEDYRQVSGVPIAHEWRFFLWSQSGGLGSQIGRATLTNVQFVDNPDFAIPENAIEVPR